MEELAGIDAGILLQVARGVGKTDPGPTATAVPPLSEELVSQVFEDI